MTNLSLRELHPSHRPIHRHSRASPHGREIQRRDDEAVRTNGIYDDCMEFETFTVAIPISASFTRHLDVQAPTADAALLLATEHALDTGVLMHGEPWIVKGTGYPIPGRPEESPS